jgi:hypothetical protein
MLEGLKVRTIYLGITLVCESTHIAAPTVSILNKHNEGVNVCSTSPTPRDNRIRNHRYRILLVSQRDIWPNCYCKWEFSLLEQRIGLRNTS